MQGKVSVEREKYRDAAQGSSPVVSAMPAIHINDQMKMSASDASYTLRYLPPAKIMANINFSINQIWFVLLVLNVKPQLTMFCSLRMCPSTCWTLRKTQLWFLTRPVIQRYDPTILGIHFHLMDFIYPFPYILSPGWQCVVGHIPMSGKHHQAWSQD